jgi:hypothetical protein
MQRFENIWMSSEDHLKVFREIKSQKKVLKNAHDPKVGEKYYDFPRIITGLNVIPVIFENIVRLVISEDSLQFYVNSNESTEQYRGINKGDNIFISYNQIKNIELIRYNTAFIRYFDNNWIKLSYFENGFDKHILFSNSGKGFVMKRLKNENIELLNLINSKIKNVAQQRV